MNRITKVLTLAAIVLGLSQDVSADKLVLLTTNDTHSQIDPGAKGLGGVMRRKVLIDSVRNVHDNVILIDAGDAVQGTLFFNIGGGKVEEELMNHLGYDYRILGNHEFDNGSDSLAKIIAGAQAQFLSTNYDMTESALRDYFKKYDIREVGGRKIGFIALNLRPKGMIAEGNYDGVVYSDAVKAADAAARYLKYVEGVDLVVAVSHIGYSPSEPPGDVDIAAGGEDIDIIIGGHTHTLVRPDGTEEKFPALVKNAAGRDVLVTQAGSKGEYVGEIEIDLDSLTADYRLLTVDARLDSVYLPEIAEIVDPYRVGIDSLMSRKIGRSAIELEQRGMPLLNFMADFMKTKGNEISENVDLGIINKYGLRRALPKGDITEGMIISMMPFNNFTVVLDILGKDLLDAFDVMAIINGNGVSEGVDITFDPETDKCVDVKINGKPLDPEKTYRVSTIDYLANGGDYMEPLKKGHIVARSKKPLYKDIVNHFETKLKGKKIRPSGEVRMRPVK